MKISRSLMVISVILLVQVLDGCNATNAMKGGAIGAGSGAVIGGAIGHNSGNTVIGAIIGAAVGGTTGALIGRHMDKQAEELKNDLKGAHVQRVGEGILITFNAGLQFDFNSTALESLARTNLNSLSSTLMKYDDTDIVIEGHTDNVGKEAYNQKLSEKRAYSVEDYIASKGVSRSRMVTKGYGEQQPLNANQTEEQRQVNRRVEVAIYANKKMKKMAEKGELGAL